MLTTVPAPANDDFDAAIFVGGLPYADVRDTRGATVAGDDPNTGAGDGISWNTVWYRLVAPFTGLVEANTSGSDHMTIVAVFTGSRGGLSLVGSNATAVATQPPVTFSAQAGTTYYIEVAAYGSFPTGGALRLQVLESAFPLGVFVASVPTVQVVAGLTPTPTLGASSILPTAPALGLAPRAGQGPAPAAVASRVVAADDRYFAATGFRVNNDAFWDYFQRRGGLRSFGYPVSREFTLRGFEVQFFQRGILQRMPDGGVAAMNLLDEGLMPYNRINFSTYPLPERELIEGAPDPRDPAYARRALEFVEANVSDRWEGMPVNFLRTFLDTVTYEDAFPRADADPALVPLLNLEMWGLPTSRPARDPNNLGFVYQRFQRGIMHYDASTGATQGLLLADYFKSILTGSDLPADLDLQARESPFYRQYDRASLAYVARPSELAATNMAGAFEVEATGPVVASAFSGNSLLVVMALVGVLALAAGLVRAWSVERRA